ncbi:hypothetical protein GW17_00012302, partial [Ensete ventricosum]
LPRLRALSTHVWVKSLGIGRASRALNITSFTIFGKCSHYPTNTRYKKNIMNNTIAHIGSTCEKCTCANMK